MSSKTKYTSLIQSETKEKKKTRFTHVITDINETSATLNIAGRYSPEEFENVMDLGKLSNESELNVFRAWNAGSNLRIFLGIKGDEFD